MELTDDGITISVKLVQSLKAFSSIEVTELEIITDVRFEHP